ncbi:uncharacterized protein LOC123511578 isoform X2 [Portunus trituberculatus]|uniref:uncharacterized protein LOC123511578 isoform X2 n=1 Tax=Portunus trituberculatus TaxID=210409 RepID=UPI001E1CF37F|nr:uncharacterized protein LOC123511578 isoform X2 [Portunus trituberculatus]
MARVDERKKEEDEEERKNESGRGGGAKTQYSGATIETEGIQRQCRKRNTELAGLQEAQSRREAGELEKNLADDSGLLKVLLDHLSEAEKDNLLLLQYSAEDTSKIKSLSVHLKQECEQVAQACLDQLGIAFFQSAAHRDHLLAQ